jgi:Ribbon-helix-helix protein, copG family
MSFFNDEQLAAGAKAKASYRLIGVTTKLSSQEVEDIERLAKKHGLQRGEFIRQLILDELARDSGDPPVSPELVEIIGLRLMLTNLLKPLTTGQKITPEVFDGIIAEVKKHKRGLAIKTRTDLEKA